jgi:hypothetical protein
LDRRSALTFQFLQRARLIGVVESVRIGRHLRHNLCRRSLSFAIFDLPGVRRRVGFFDDFLLWQAVNDRGDSGAGCHFSGIGADCFSETC